MPSSFFFFLSLSHELFSTRSIDFFCVLLGIFTTCRIFISSGFLATKLVVVVGMRLGGRVGIG